MNKKESKEKVVAKKKGHDDVTQEKNEMEEQIEKILEMTPDGLQIMEKIRNTLTTKGYRYRYDENIPSCIVIPFEICGKQFEIQIVYLYGRLSFTLNFPFRVRANAIPIVCMYIAEFNADMAFSILNNVFKSGRLTMDYSYMIENPAYFDERDFSLYMDSLIEKALDIYMNVEQLAVGMVPTKKRNVYKRLLEMALDTINGDFDDDEVGYGTSSLRLDSQSYLSHPHEEAAGVDRDDCISDDNESENQTMNMEGIFSFFNKKDEDMDPKAIGGGENE